MLGCMVSLHTHTQMHAHTHTHTQVHTHTHTHAWTHTYTHDYGEILPLKLISRRNL